MDLRSTIGAVAHLPFDSERLVEILCETEPEVSSDPGDQDHAIFWLVIADQFSKRGIVSEHAREKALAIIDTGADIAMLTKLEMDPSGLRKRQKILDELRGRLLAPPMIGKPRTVLKKPQALLMDIGEVFVYPTFGGKCLNPYFTSKADNQYLMPEGMVPWTQDGWSAMVIVDRGRAFDFLSWYRPLTISEAASGKPAVEGLLHDEILWKLARAGTCSAAHYKRMELEKIGSLPLDDGRLRRAFSGMKPGISAAVSDISIANTLNVGPAVPASVMPRPGEALKPGWGRPYATILGIRTILSA